MKQVLFFIFFFLEGGNHYERLVWRSTVYLLTELTKLLNPDDYEKELTNLQRLNNRLLEEISVTGRDVFLEWLKRKQSGS